MKIFGFLWVEGGGVIAKMDYLAYFCVVCRFFFYTFKGLFIKVKVKNGNIV